MGYITDVESGDTIPFATVSYKNLKVHTVADAAGHYRIARHNGQQITVTAVGYTTQTISINSSTPNHLDVKMKADTRMLQNVTVKTKRQRYRRKDNPAVELVDGGGVAVPLVQVGCLTVGIGEIGVGGLVKELKVSIAQVD